jgi:hypothetical protein
LNFNEPVARAALEKQACRKHRREHRRGDAAQMLPHVPAEKRDACPKSGNPESGAGVEPVELEINE